MGVNPLGESPKRTRGARWPAALAALALIGLVAGGRAHAAPPGPPLGPPVLTGDGRVRWTPAPVSPGLLEAARAMCRECEVRPDGRDTLALWFAVLTPLSDEHVRRAIARRLLVAGDTLRADSAYASVLALPQRHVWEWDALAARVAVAQARGDTAGADALLASWPDSLRRDWPDADRAAWLAARIRTRAALGDTTEALRLARQAIRAFPSLSATNRALASLDLLSRRRGDTLTWDEQRAAADVEAFRGNRSGRDAALARLARLAARAPRDIAFRAHLRRAEILRDGRRFADAQAAATRALALAAIDVERTWAELERARALRDLGRTDSAIAAYRRAAALAPSGQTRALAHWELARDAEDKGRWETAANAFREVAAFTEGRASDAAFRVGLMSFVLGQSDSASAWLARGAGDEATFWFGVVARDRARTLLRGRARLSDAPESADLPGAAAWLRAPTRADSVDARRWRAAGDSALQALAARPGYNFYRVGARDTLGVRGWSARPTAATGCDSLGDPHCGVVADARKLQAWGAAEEAQTLLRRFIAGDRRFTSGPARAPVDMARVSARDVLEAAAVYYAAGLPRPGSDAVDRAIARASALNDSAYWALWPWTYPPAYQALIRAHTVDSLGIDEATLASLIRQESRFDTYARSSSNALGLAQLLLSTAGDVARWLKDPRPTEARLFRPEIGVRYGSAYFAWLLRRFDRRMAVALSAYNAGPGTIPPFWRELIARGGEALFCEIASNADAQDYARKILGYRQAYREMRPFAAE